ncbi:MAG: hypothetical protein OSB00_05240 [Sphingomonas bacterium]|nr:hypothetical protein [Sphingomonas bacterium]
MFPDGEDTPATTFNAAAQYVEIAFDFSTFYCGLYGRRLCKRRRFALSIAEY